GDTGRFMYAETTPATLKAAYELAATGIDITEIAMNISTVTLEQAKLQNSVIDLLHVDPCGAAYAVVTQQQLHKLGINEDQASATIGTPGRIKGIIAWNIFVEKADGTYRVHYRSKGPIINQLAEQHNGGGHALASGANAVDMKEVEQIFAEVVEVTKKYNENANE
ncbi:MAG: DHHA1 domain-containing protein, partial [Lactobacillus iners]|nr:DHHA1 domain-containing protein [Lactobacillus iners]